MSVRSSRQKWIFVIALVLTLFVVVMMLNVLADDGRLNGGVHLGGLSVYCTGDVENIRVLDQNGGEVLYVDSTTLSQFPVAPSVNTRIATTMTPLGRLDLYRLTTGEFQLNGYDEHGKPFAFIWEGCREASEDSASSESPRGTSRPGNPPLPSLAPTNTLPSSTPTDITPSLTPTLTPSITITKTPTNTPTDTLVPTLSPFTAVPSLTPLPPTSTP
ncbi:MAG: hypothetical protein K8I60_13470 [Anaerolineae bacterium]|nr:hypothetical protein [Anaerolineae bacterium]